MNRERSRAHPTQASTVASEQRLGNLVLVGDEAYTADEWRQLERRREYHRRYYSKPDKRARKLEYMREYRNRKRPQPCPGERCLTMVVGGGLCQFCRRAP